MNTKKRRIVHIIHTLDPGGCEHMLLSLLPFLNRNGWEASIITLGPGGALSENFLQSGIPVQSEVLQNAFDISGFRKLKETVQQLRPGLAVAHLLPADILARLSGGHIANIPFIPLVHSTYRDIGQWKALLFELITTRSLRRCFTVSPSVARVCERRGLSPGAARIIPNPVDTDRFHPVQNIQERERLRKEFSLSNQDYIVTCVANFHPYKRHKDLLHGFSLLLKKIGNAKLVLVGIGPEERSLKNLSQKLGLDPSIKFLGRRNDVDRILAMSDVFVLPSLFEGMSIALLEAMASGLPCVATDTPENRDLFPDTPQTLIPPKNLEHLAKMLFRVARNKDLQIRLGIQMRKEVEMKYSLEVIEKRWREIYDESLHTAL
jgi:glycosyltransferase involved in cell wall biosynthesis